MKRLIFFLLILNLTACSQATVDSTSIPTFTPEAVATVATLTPTKTARPTPTASPTSTAVPTLTPYPAFNPLTAQTQTPLPPAICPSTNPDLEITLNVSDEIHPNKYDEAILEALETGASLPQGAQAFDQVIKRTVKVFDLTGDNVLELVVYEHPILVIIGCDDGNYTQILEYDNDSDFGTYIATAPQDMNLNGVPEIVLAYSITTGWNAVVDILEWDGGQYVSLIQANHGFDSINTSTLARALYWFDIPNEIGERSSNWKLPVMNGGADFDVRDLDRNGTKELILTDEGPSHQDTLLFFGPWRGQKMTFTWDGIHFLYSDLEMTIPEYRFQAVQDADRFFLLGKYDHALRLYQDVIFSDGLKWWSPERRVYERDYYYYQIGYGSKPEILLENTGWFIFLGK